MSKTVLSRDEAVLLIHSEELKNTSLYGNLYEILSQVDVKKALSLEDLSGLDEKAKFAVTRNKKNLRELVVQEWHATRMLDEDAASKTRCGLCNTPNKYIFYIENTVNHKTLNVGSTCIKAFPNLEGLTELEKRKANAIQNRQVVNRRTLFYNQFPNCEEIIQNAESHFNTLPYLLPYELYHGLQDNVQRMRRIFADYVQKGTKPFKSDLSSFELFQKAIDQHEKLQRQSDAYMKQCKDHTLRCMRREIDWLLSNRRNGLLDMIAKNNGIYNKQTLKEIWSFDFVYDYYRAIVLKNQSKYFVFQNMKKERQIAVRFRHESYTNDIVFSIPLKSFMQKVGAYCILDQQYRYGDNEIAAMAQMDMSYHNLYAIIDRVFGYIRKNKCIVLIEQDTNTLYFMRRPDRAIKSLPIQTFLKEYEKVMFSGWVNISRYFDGILLSEDGWKSKEEQGKIGLDEKIFALYREQYEEERHRLKCPECGAEATKVMVRSVDFESSYDGQRGKSNRCRNCGYIWK